ncbi:MAG: phage major capsid protein [Planctomycetota bacterium]
MSTQLKMHKEKRGAAGKEMRGILDLAKTEKRELNESEIERFDQAQEDYDQHDAAIKREERVEQIEAEQRGTITPADLPIGDETRDQETPEELEVRCSDAVNTALRLGPDQLKPEQRALLSRMAAQSGIPETRAVTVQGIGVVGTRRTLNQLVKEMAIFDGIRQLGASVITTNNGNPMTIPTGTDTANKAVIIGEAPASSPAAVNPNLGNAALTAYKYAALPIEVSTELLDDNEFDAEAHIMAMASERIGRGFNEHTTKGTGSGQPQGVNTAVPAGKVVEAQANAAIDFDDLLNLKGGVDAAYWPDPSTGYQFSQTTVIGARKLKDNEGRPIWEPAFQGNPESMNGHRVVINNEYANFGAAANQVVASFGCAKKYYIRDVARPLIIRDPYTAAGRGMVVFHVHSRHGGNLSDTAAFAVLDLPAA